MKASIILTQMGKDYQVQNEKDFDYLGMYTSKYKGVLCTFAEDARYLNAEKKGECIVFTTEKIAEENPSLPAIITSNPRIAFFEMHNYLLKNSLYDYKRKPFETVIGENCRISKMANVDDHNVILGNNVVVEEFASIKADTIIGDNCIIRAGTIIGGEGFEHKRNHDEIISVIHGGGVIIKNDVEIQQNSCIDRAVFPWDNTVIGEMSKIDNLVHIAHAAKIEKRVLIATLTCVAGRVSIGDDTWIGPGVTIRNGIKIGSKAKISLGSVVTKDVEEGQQVTGYFAIEHSKYIEFVRNIR